MKKYWMFILVISLLCLFGCSERRNSSNEGAIPLKIYNWEDYLGSQTLKQFTRSTGIEVILDTYEDEEEMFAYIRSNLSAYDLVIASDDMVREMIDIKILSPVDVSKIPNMQYIDDNFLHLDFDPQQQYSVPYLWGTTGLVVNSKYVEMDGDSWAPLYDPQYGSRIAMLNNPYEIMTPVFKLMGASINVTDPDLFNNAAEIVFQQKEYIAGYFDVISIQEMLIDEQIWVAQIYSGEGMVACDSNDDLTYIIPNEGTAIWLDNLVIPRDSTNTDAAHAFINFIHDPEINSQIASELWYATPNGDAIQYMDDEVRNSPMVFPDEATLSNCEYYEDIGLITNKYSQLWSNLH